MKRTPYFVIWLNITAVILLAICAGCSTPKIVTVTEYRDRATHDTLTRADSIYVAHYVREKGDTVRITDTIFMFKTTERVQNAYIHDSVPYAVEVQVPVRVRNGYDRFTSWGFWLLLLLLIIRIAWWAVKKYYLRR